MSRFYGADTEALRTMSSVLVRRADAVSDIESALTAALDALEWVGEDAEEFRAEWSGRVRPGLQDGNFELRQRARRLLQEADEQDRSSAADSPGSSGGGGAGRGSGSGGAGSDSGGGAGGGSGSGGGAGTEDPSLFDQIFGNSPGGQAIADILESLTDDLIAALVGDGSTPFQQWLG